MDNISKIRPICLKCTTNIPTFRPLQSHNEYFIICDCGYRERLSIEEYVKQYNNQIELVSYPTNITKTIDISLFKERMQLANEHLENYFRNLSDKFTFKGIKAISEKEYERNKIQIEFVNIFIQAFESFPNSRIYDIITNIFDDFMIYTLKEKYDSTYFNAMELEAFFKEYNIVKGHHLSFSKLKKKATITSLLSEDKVSCILPLQGIMYAFYFIVGFESGKIKIYSSDKEENSFYAHKSKVVEIQRISIVSKKYIVSYSTDLSIIIWIHDSLKDTLEKYKVITNPHGSMIYQVEGFDEKNCASCGDNNIINVYTKGKVLFVGYYSTKHLKGHTKFVTSILPSYYHYNVLFSGSEDNTLKVWDLSNFKCTKTIENIKCGKSKCIRELKKDILIIGGNNIIQVVNVDKGTIDKKICEVFGTFKDILTIRKDDTHIMGMTDKGLCIINLMTNSVDYQNIGVNKEVTTLVDTEERYIAYFEDNDIYFGEFSFSSKMCVTRQRNNYNKSLMFRACIIY